MTSKTLFTDSAVCSQAANPAKLAVADVPRTDMAIPTLAEQEAEERRLAREKVLAARRMSLNAAPNGGLQDQQKMAKTNPKAQRHSLAPSHMFAQENNDNTSITARNDSSDGPTFEKDLRAVLRESNDGRPSPTVSAVYPLPPAALKTSNLPQATAPAHSVQTMDNGFGQIYSETSKHQLIGSSSTEAGSPPEGSHVFKRDFDETPPLRTDAEGKSLAELKMSFTMRMNEAIRMQRERMRVLLSDVDSKIVSLKNEHGLEELPGDETRKEAVLSTPGGGAQSLQVAVSPQVHESDNKENDSRFLLFC